MTQTPADIWERVISLLKALDTMERKFYGPGYHLQIMHGRNLFLAFSDLGQMLRARNETVKQAPSSLVSPIVNSVTAHQEWIGDFIYNYGSREIELDGLVRTIIHCGIRSGIQFLVDDFAGISEEFDVVLRSWNEEDIEQFDISLKVWVHCGCRETLKPGELPINIPAEHWWWF